MAASLRSIGALGCALASSFLAGCPPTGSGPSNYVEVLRTSPAEPIDLVHVKQLGAASLALEIYYSSSSKKEAWNTQQGSVPTTPTPLGPREDFVLSRDWMYLGVRSLVPSAAGIQTSFKFLTAPPGIQPPSAVRGAREILLSADAGQFLFIERQGESDGPATATGFRLDPQNQGFYQESGSYQTTDQGVVQLSQDGRLLAQADGGKLLILTSTGESRGTTSTGIGFTLAREGHVLAVREPNLVRFLPLEADGTPIPTQEQQMSVPGTPLDVEIDKDWAVILTRGSVHLVEWRTGTQLWQRTITQGVAACADLVVGPPKILVAIGRLQQQKAQKRNGATPQWGTALGHVDLVDANGQDAFPSHSFRTERWSFDEPRVRILTEALRVVVRTDDLVLVSKELPKSLFR